MRRFSIIICLFLTVPFTWIWPSCNYYRPKEITPAFYYWRSEFDPSSSEKKYLSEKAVLYIRFFDVVWNAAAAQPVPESPLHFGQLPDSSLQYVPVVFITNETLAYCSANQMPTLADHILKKIESIESHFYTPCKEVQIDCDWTVSTRDKYFLLLKEIKERLQEKGRKLSVTLRLHQIKYREKTGIPPVDRCMLMFYNMGDWKAPQTANSLYDLQVADKYMKRINDYPLPLDIALPLLRWTIVYRNNKFLTFINYIAADSLKQYEFLEQVRGGPRFLAAKDTFAFGCYFRKGDLLRSESCSFDHLIKGKDQLLHRIKNHQLTLSLFHLDEKLLKHYSYDEIQKIFSSVQ